MSGVESPAQVGKREFVRALSVDENDNGGGDVFAAQASGAAGAKEENLQDFRYLRYVPEEQEEGWWDPGAEHLRVRDSNYLDDKKKVNSESAVFDCVEIETYQVPKKIRKVEHMAIQPFSAFRHIRKKAPPGTPYKGAPGSGFTFIVQFQAPGYGVTMYYQRKASEKLGDEGGGKAFESALKDFLEGDLDYKTRHLKFFPLVTEGAWIVRKVVGGKPAIIAKKIDTTFHEGDNYFEVNVDVSSSSVAKNILRVVKSYAKKITFDMAWGFEGKKVEHLPERILGISRFAHVHVSALPVLDSEVVGASDSGED